jgi:hypothetical protein
MLRPLLETRGYGLRSIDKDLGGVEDYYFDDRLWTLRYLVADTGNWLPGRTVLIGMESVGEPEWEDQVIPITLTSAQIEDSPGIEQDLPFSLQKERELRLFFQWREYWNEEIFIQRTGDRPLETENPKEPGNSSSMSGDAKLPKVHGNPHLRSANEIQEYTVRAHHEEIGYLEDFLIWVPSWEIRYVVIDTRNWLSREKILISPRWITALDWSLQAIDVDISREKIEKSPGFTPGEPITSDYETTLHHYYGQPQNKER